jgi:hypothetical protein
MKDLPEKKIDFYPSAIIHYLAGKTGNAFIQCIIVETMINVVAINLSSSRRMCCC